MDVVDVLSFEASDLVRAHVRSSKGNCWVNEMLFEFLPQKRRNLDAALPSLPVTMRRSCIVDVVNLQ